MHLHIIVFSLKAPPATDRKEKLHKNDLEDNVCYGIILINQDIISGCRCRYILKEDPQPVFKIPNVITNLKTLVSYFWLIECERKMHNT